MVSFNKIIYLEYMFYCICEYQENKKMKHTILLVITALVHSGLTLWIQPDVYGSWYLISQSESLTFFEAEEKCLSRNGHLAKINGTKEYDESIVSQFGGNKEYWIGLSGYQRDEYGNWTVTSNIRLNENFRWIDCSEDLTPDLSGDENLCVSYKDINTWYSRTVYELTKQNCYNRNHYICESKEQDCDEVEVSGFYYKPTANSIYRRYNDTCVCCGDAIAYISENTGWFIYYNIYTSRWHISEMLCKTGYYKYSPVFIKSNAKFPHHISDGRFDVYEYYDRNRHTSARNAKFSCRLYHTNISDDCKTIYDTTSYETTTNFISDYSSAVYSDVNGNKTSFIGDSEGITDSIMFYLLIAIVILIVIFAIVFIVLLVTYRRLLHKRKVNAIKDDRVTKGQDEADLYSYTDAKNSVHGENLSDVYAEVQ